MFVVLFDALFVMNIIMQKRNSRKRYLEKAGKRQDECDVERMRTVCAKLDRKRNLRGPVRYLEKAKKKST